MGSSQTMIYIVANTSPVENFKHGWKNDTDANMATFFSSCENFLGIVKPSDNKLGLHRTSSRGICLLFFFILSIMIPTVVSNNFVLDWNSWTTGALQHRGLNQPLDQLQNEETP